MFQKNKLKATIIDRNKNIADIANLLNITRKTMYGRINEGNFSRKEIDLIKDYLKLTPDEVQEIFFA